MIIFYLLITRTNLRMIRQTRNRVIFFFWANLIFRIQILIYIGWIKNDKNASEYMENVYNDTIGETLCNVIIYQHSRYRDI